MQRYKIVEGAHGHRDDTDGLVRIYRRGEAIMLSSEAAARMGKQVTPWPDDEPVEEDEKGSAEAPLKTTQARPVAKSKSGQPMQPGDTHPPIPEATERNSERG